MFSQRNSLAGVVDISLPGPLARKGVPAPVVLLAEDNSINAEMMAMMAEKLGVSVERAENGQDAIEMVQLSGNSGTPYALVLMDVMMPILDGVSAARALRKAGFTADVLPIIAVTAAATSAETKTYLAAGMQACLSKPVRRDALSAAFDTWLVTPASAAGRGGDRLVSSLWLRYEHRKAETIKRIKIANETQDYRPETVNEIRNLLHKLAGTAGSFGEAALSEAATQCENALISASPQRVPETLLHSCALLLKAA
jgi:CheY-like chemotaxis protein